MTTPVATTTTNDAVIGQLAQLSEERFRAVVDEDVRDRAPAPVHDALRSRELIQRTYDTLLTMQRSVEGQIAAKAAETKAQVRRLLAAKARAKASAVQADFDHWRAGCLRFKTGLDIELIEVRSVLRRYGLYTTVLEAQRNEAARQGRLLRQAIEAHRAAVDSPEHADEALWEVLEA
jgi:hypothetical protein